MLCIAWWHSRVRDFNYSIFPFAYPFQVDCTHFMLGLIFAKKGLKSCSCHFKPIFPNQSGPNHLLSRWFGPCDFTMPFCEHKQKEVTNSKLFASWTRAEKGDYNLVCFSRTRHLPHVCNSKAKKWKFMSYLWVVQRKPSSSL